MTQQPELRATYVSTEQTRGGPTLLKLELAGLCDPQLAQYLEDACAARKPLTFALMEVGQPVPVVVPQGGFYFDPATREYSYAATPVLR